MARRIPRTTDNPYPLDYIYASHDDFEDNRDTRSRADDMIAVEQPNGATLYGFTPDGVGYYWYKTDEAMFADRL